MKYFLDCGSRIGESIEKFFGMYDNAKDFSIFMFEPNPVCYDLLCSNPRFTKHEKMPFAVSNRNGKAKLWGCVKTNTSVGATLEHSKADWDKIESDDFVEVELMDLSTFIINNFSFNDYIILKLNIEGAEYDVLEGLLRSGAADKISQYYVDFHTQWLAPEFAGRERELRKKFKEIGKPLNGWNY
jgi:FkbM family methyltransferase